MAASIGGGRCFGNQLSWHALEQGLDERGSRWFSSTEGGRMRVTMAFLVLSSALMAENIRLLPSNGKIRSVILQYLPAASDIVPNPRVQLIKEVRRVFPRLDIKITSDVPLDELWKREPALKTMVNDAVYLPGNVNHNEIQDPFEFGWNDSTNTPAIFYLNRPTYADFEPVLSLWKNRTVLDVPGNQKPPVPEPGTDGSGGRSAGGNVEVLPNGIPVMGSNSPQDSIDFFRRVAGDVVLVDSGWTGSGDLDEIFLWANDPTGKDRCLLFQLDALAGSTLITPAALDEWKRATKDDFFDFYSSLGMTVTREFVDHPQTERERRLSATVKQQIEGTLVYLSKGQDGIGDIQSRIERSGDVIMAAPGMQGCRRVRLPVIYSLSDNSLSQGNRDRYSFVFNNQINSLVIGNHVFALDSGFPAQRKEIERIYHDNGFTVHWFSAIGFNAGGGNMHCNVNIVREP